MGFGLSGVMPSGVLSVYPTELICKVYNRTGAYSLAISCLDLVFYGGDFY